MKYGDCRNDSGMGDRYPGWRNSIKITSIINWSLVNSGEKMEKMVEKRPLFNCLIYLGGWLGRKYERCIFSLISLSTSGGMIILATSFLVAGMNIIRPFTNCSISIWFSAGLSAVCLTVMVVPTGFFAFFPISALPLVWEDDFLACATDFVFLWFLRVLAFIGLAFIDTTFKIQALCSF